MIPFAFYIISLIIIIILGTILFFVAQMKKDNSIVDIAYGLGFIVTSYLTTLLIFKNSALTGHSFIILILITIWGIRLSLRIYRKNKGKSEDFRYKAWREEWTKKGMAYYYLRTYFQIFILQGIVISLVLLPFTQSISSFENARGLMFFGLILWIVGFCFEVIGDKQLDRFIKSKSEHKGTIMKTGLWKYTRHPNYFGESTMWCGLSFIALSSGASLIVLLSPILITFLLLKVSGIPMLEKKWEGNEEWEAYKRKTSAFIPLPPK